MENQNGVVGEIRYLSIDDLELDIDNPRFELAPHEKTQADLANKLIMGYEVMTIAESIARNGYFANDPLVAVVSEQNPGKFVVVEGNRRLAALKALTDASFRQELFQPEFWLGLAETSALGPNPQIPVSIVSDRNKINPILGYRHISGINGWQPLAQARFIARMVDEDSLDFEQTSESVGKKINDVASMYRNQAIVRQAAELGFEVARMETSFSLLTLAMGAPALREFVSAPLGQKIEIGQNPIPKQKKQELVELLGWIFGDENHEPVIAESREINKLGKVVQNPLGLKILRETRSLKEAEEAIKEAGLDPLQRLLMRLKTANESSKAAFDDLSDFREDPQVIAFVASILENAESLSSSLEKHD
jgi:hypothetical protein